MWLAPPQETLLEEQRRPVRRARTKPAPIISSLTQPRPSVRNTNDERRGLHLRPVSLARSCKGPARQAHAGEHRHLLAIVRILIGYGLHLAETLEHRAAARGFATIAQFFGTARVATIHARLCRGLLRAMALERVLLARAARGRDLVAYTPRAASAQRGRRASRVTAAAPHRPGPTRAGAPTRTKPLIPPTSPPWSSSWRRSGAVPSAGRWPISAATSASRPACVRGISGSK